MLRFVKHAYELGKNLAMQKHANPALLAANTGSAVPDVDTLIRNSLADSYADDYLSAPEVEYGESPEARRLQELADSVMNVPLSYDFGRNSLLFRGRF